MGTTTVRHQTRRRSQSRTARIRAIVGAVLAIASVATLATSPAAAVQVIVTDVAKQAGVFESNKSWSACESGDLLYVGGHQLSSHLYQSNGAGLYESLPLNGAWPLKTPSARADRHGCAWADFDLNGLADMYNTTGRNESNFVKPDGRDNELWLQTVPGLFTDVGTALGLGDPCTRGRHAAAGDLDGDGWADIVEGVAIGRDDPSDPCNIPANGYPSENPKVYLNLGADPSGQWQGFAAGQDLATDDDPGQRGVELFDVDRDGDLDILGIRLKSKTPVVYVNDGSAGFTAERKTDNGLTTAVSDASRYDVDGDGDLDLVEARKTSCGWQPADGFGRYGKYKAIVTFSGEGRSVAIGRTAAGLAVYCQVQADSGNPTDYVGVLSGTTWAKYTAPAAAGLADEVYAIHPDSSGNVQFLVLNGGNGGEAGVGGPVQLVKVSVQ